jgi:predicted RNase H-like HicB family nuclease
MVLKVVIEPSDEGGYTAWVPSLPGCVSEGDTIDETMANIREAIELYLEPIDEIEPEREGVVVKELVV